MRARYTHLRHPFHIPLHHDSPRTLWVALLLALLFLPAMPAILRAAPPSAEVLYERLACAECHGADGRTPRWDTTPIIAGQQVKYTYLALRAYKTGERGGLMSVQHAEVNDLLTDEAMHRLAEYVATLK